MNNSVEIAHCVFVLRLMLETWFSLYSYKLEVSIQETKFVADMMSVISALVVRGVYKW